MRSNMRYKEERVGSLKRLMEREISKITQDDIRGTDIPIEYVAGFAIVLVALLGGVVFHSYRNSERSLPLTHKNRLD